MKRRSKNTCFFNFVFDKKIKINKTKISFKRRYEYTHSNSDKKSALTNIELVNRFNVSESTVSQWKHREVQTDRSSRPANIKYALSPLGKALERSMRETTWLS